MNCDNPFTKDGCAYGCGQCIPCRLNKRREWQHRLILEACDHADNTFATLTYSDKHYPLDHSVSPTHVQLFLKRLRKAYAKPIRHFSVGEYGEDTFRPHYHLALFGYSSCFRGRTRKDLHAKQRSCCPPCDLLLQCWGKGAILLDELNPTTSAYIAGYVTKKLTKANDERLEGRHPEFARMSNRPGIGLALMHDLASLLMEHNLDTLIDVPTQLEHGTTRYPLGKYLRRKLRTFIGRSPSCPEAIIQNHKQEMQALRENTPNITSLKTAVVFENQGKRLRIEQKAHRNRKRGSL